jgi:hypothetical protein
VSALRCRLGGLARLLRMASAIASVALAVVALPARGAEPAGGGTAIGAGAEADARFGEPVEGTMEPGNRPGNPTFELPSNMRLVSPFGERPVFAPDGTHIAFIGESYGDAFEYDLTTGVIRNLTAHAAHKGFLRIHYLADGSFVLLGPRVPAATREATRNSAIELFWMDADATGVPVALERTVWEGIAVSRSTSQIAWSETRPLAPSFAEVQSVRVMVGTVAATAGQPRLENVRQVLERKATDCLVEPQDFVAGDSSLVMPCYYLPAARSQRRTDVAVLDLDSGRVHMIPTPGTLYGEVEGVFPDGRHALVECSGDRAIGMDICLLEIDRDEPAYTRLTHVMEYGHWKFGNPVVSADGRRVAMQIGSADVIDAGVGQGIVLMELPANFP